MKLDSENSPKYLRISEVAGNLLKETPTNIVLFGYFNDINITGQSKLNSDINVSINGISMASNEITFKSNSSNLQFNAQIPTSKYNFDSGYQVLISSNQEIVHFTIQNAGALPDNLSNDELFKYLKNQIWFYHQIVNDRSKRLYAIEHSLSWKITKPLRYSLDVISALPKLLSKNGMRFFWNAITNSTEKNIIQKLNNAVKPIDNVAVYQHFIQKQAWGEPTIDDIKIQIQNFDKRPLISIVIPTFNTPVNYLKECIESVTQQSYKNWEICIYDDASTNKETLALLKKYNEQIESIKVKFGEVNEHISGASNQAVKLAKGDFIGLLDHDDLLISDALFEVVKHININTEVDFIYSDEDKLTLKGQRVDPYFKSDFNLDLFLSNNYLNHFSVFKKSLFDKVDGFRKGYEGSQDYDLFLRMLSAKANFGHIDKVLYHWRKIPGSTAESYSAKSYPEEASQKALNDYLMREKIQGLIKKGEFPGSFRLERKLVTSSLVSIIIPFKDQVELLKTCVEGINKTVIYQNIELVLVNNDSQKQETLDYLESIKHHHTILKYSGDFNYSAINNYAVSKAKGEFVLLLNNDIEPLKTGWFEAMLEHIQRKKVGAVGAKLLYPDYSIQHAGVILGINGVASHGFKHLPHDTPGYFMRANATQNLSACTAACLMIKKSVFEEVKGFDAKNLKIAFNDIDLCLKIREAGYLIVYTPYAELIHHESKSRGLDSTPEKMERFASEVSFMKNKWKNTLQNDPYYNSNLTLEKEDFSLKL